MPSTKPPRARERDGRLNDARFSPMTTRVRGSRTGRPIMALLDLLGRRWALRILWELREAALGFTELQSRCDTMSPSVLNQRLRDLRDAGILELREGRYTTTALGRRLHAPLLALSRWANEWAKQRHVRSSGPAARRRPRISSSRTRPAPPR